MKTIYTQIGGKYHSDDDSVFRLKARLTHLGVSVSHPIADEIKATSEDHGYAFDPAEQSFIDVERHYYESIRNCDFHVVCNQFGAQLGYLGESASLEIAYAMCQQRPIVLLHPADLKPSVDGFVRALLTPCLDQLIIFNFLAGPDDEVSAFLTSLNTAPIDYVMTSDEQSATRRRVKALLSGLKHEVVDAST